MPLWALQWASVAQNAALLALASIAGVALAPKVHLAAPVLSALAIGKPVFEPLRSQLLPGLIGGVVGAALLWLFSACAPDALAQLQAKQPMPAVVRILYGGISEEILLRWGLMTLLAWLPWRVGKGGVGAPSATIMWVAVAASAVVFGVGHLPAASAVLGQVSIPLAAYIVLANAAFGLVAGWLFWRFGLESAMLAHSSAHAVVLIGSL